MKEGLERYERDGSMWWDAFSLQSRLVEMLITGTTTRTKYENTLLARNWFIGWHVRPLKSYSKKEKV